MNPAALESYLGTFWWKQLRDLARELQLSQKGSRADIIARVLAMHDDPCCSLQVVNAAVEVERQHRRSGSKKRRRGADHKDAVVRALCSEFEAAAKALMADGIDAISNTTEIISETLDAAECSDNGSFVAESPDTATSRPPPPPRPEFQSPKRQHAVMGGQSVVMGQQVVDGMPAPSPGELVYVPPHLCPWQPSPMKC